MSTRSGIGILMSPNRIKGIYCHHDGYLEGGVGEILFKYIHDGAEAEELIDMGDRSYINDEDFNVGVYTDEGYTYDRVKPQIYTYDKFAQFQEYNYVWVDEVEAWYVACRYSRYQYVSLRDALKGNFNNPVNLDEVLNSGPLVSGGMNPSQEEVEDFFLDASTNIRRSKRITAADELDEMEDPRVDEMGELQDRVEDDFDYVIAGIERLGRLEQYDEAIDLLTTLSDTLNSAINIIGNNFESGSDIGEDDVTEEL